MRVLVVSGATENIRVVVGVTNEVVAKGRDVTAVVEDKVLLLRLVVHIKHARQKMAEKLTRMIFS